MFRHGILWRLSGSTRNRIETGNAKYGPEEALDFNVSAAAGLMLSLVA